MRLSKKSRYGLRALIDLSVHSKTEHVSLNNIAERNGISLQYLEQVFASLRRAGIVKSVKGPQGGYLLGYPAAKITVSQILEALEGPYEIEKEELSEGDEAQGMSVAIQKLVIDQINEKLKEVLDHVTLEDLESEYLYYNEYSQDMYYI